MISHENKCIFIHQRKCAGVSIIKSFGLELNNPDWHYMNEGVLSPEFHTRPPYFTFSIVRNPWERFVSAWLYCDGTKNRSMRDVLRYLPQFEHDYIHITRLQRDILFDLAGYLVADQLIRFENLQSDFDQLCDRIKKERLVLPHLNGDVGVLPYQEYFTDPIDRDLFARHFHRDIETFQYEF